MTIELYKFHFVFLLFCFSISQKNRTCNWFYLIFLSKTSRKFVQFGIVSIVNLSDFVNLAELEPLNDRFFIDFSGICCILNLDVICCLKRQIRTRKFMEEKL